MDTERVPGRNNCIDKDIEVCKIKVRRAKSGNCVWLDQTMCVSDVFRRDEVSHSCLGEPCYESELYFETLGWPLKGYRNIAKIFHRVNWI